MSPRTDRLRSVAHNRGKHLVAAGAERMASTLRDRSKKLAYAGTALAVVGVGSTIAAGTASAATTPAAASRARGVHATAGHGPASTATTSASAAALPAIAGLTSVQHGLPFTPAMPPTHHGTATTPAAASRAPGVHAPAGRGPSTATTSASAATLPSIAALTSVQHALPLTPAMPPTQHGTGSQAPSPPPPPVVTWTQVRNEINQQTNPAAARLGQLPAADQLTPAGTSGPQAWMPLSPAQLSNATTIVQQALNKKMGLRSAVIAVATAMQESQLLNLHYGDQDSLGLFQQRPSMGWGTAAQITDPSFAADAFLGALQQYQAGDPAWASQPLWASAQAVQKSGFPFAYAKWESQAAGLVKQVAMQLK